MSQIPVLMRITHDHQVMAIAMINTLAPPPTTPYVHIHTGTYCMKAEEMTQVNE